MNSALAASLTYNELEYFSYLNHWLLFLFFLIVTFYSVLKVTTACLNKIHYNDAVLEFASTLFLLAFLLLVVSPALIVLLDIDSVVMPSFIIYNLGFQWAWTYSISYLHSNIGFTSYHDHYILSSYFYQSLNCCQQGASSFLTPQNASSLFTPFKGLVAASLVFSSLSSLLIYTNRNAIISAAVI